MGIKLKNCHRLTAVVIALVILLPSLAMMVIRPHYINYQKGNEEIPYSYSPELMSLLVKNTYVLYLEELQNQSEGTLSPFHLFFSSSQNTEAPYTEDASVFEEASKASDGVMEMEEQAAETFDNSGMAASDFENTYRVWYEDFSSVRSYLEYEVLDATQSKVLDTNQSIADSVFLHEALDNIQTNSVLHEDCEYAFVAVIEYGEKGNIEATSFSSHEKNNASQVLNEAARENPIDLSYYENLDLHFQKPQNRVYYFAVTQESFLSLINNNPSLVFQETQNYDSQDLVVVFLTLMAAVAIAALLLPLCKPLKTGNEPIFTMPFELVVFVGCVVTGFSVSVSADPYTMDRRAIYTVLTSIGASKGIANTLQYIWGLLGWIVVFSLCYWAVSCLRAIFTLGPKRYMKERILTYRIWPWMCRVVQNVYQSLLHVNLRDDATRVLVKVVLTNFVILGFISLFWVWGIGALLIYSVVLFFLLRKYFQRIQEQYQLLLEATNELAKGNLNGTIPEDLGVFETFRDEIDRIQAGFKKAVEEEVKSTKMKTDLITNVSHDLKTPLTAIITYVDLLKKKELSEEEREKYIQILDQKTNQLKILIEDLFEVSKANSKAITLNIMDVDIVSLLQQVKLELEDKIAATDLTFRWQLSKEKIILPLDSQRTYRVFENLLLNITKYALPHTRVYVHMENTDNHVKITMKNISATELNFNPNEITERFVRGDASRNTEGSGLGLAIAKSFTELQGGRLEIFVDADLFTAEITFLKQ